MSGGHSLGGALRGRFIARCSLLQYAYRLNEGNVKEHSLHRMNALCDKLEGKKLTCQSSICLSFNEMFIKSFIDLIK